MYVRKSNLKVITLIISFLLIGVLLSNLIHIPKKTDVHENNLIFSVDSLSGAFKPDVNSLNSEKLLELLPLIGFNQPYSFSLLQGPARFHPKVVIFQFAEIEDLENSKKNSLSYKQKVNNEIIKGIATNFDEETSSFTYTFYFKYSNYNGNSEYVEKDWKEAIILALFASSLQNRPFTYDELGELFHKLDIQSLDLLRVDKKSISLKVLLLNSLKFVIETIQPNQVYAACNGYFTCGSLDYVCTECPNSGSCGIFGLCSDNQTPCGCGDECVGNWAISCSVRGSENQCNNLSEACYSGCVSSSSCSWSAPNPSVPPPTPPPSGGPGGTTCWRCLNNIQCALTTSNEPCGCEACTQYTSRKAVYLFDDSINENGIWEPQLGEKRISSNSSCPTSNTTYLANAAIVVNGQTYTDSCNVGTSEYNGQTCDSGSLQCYNNATPPQPISSCNLWTANGLSAVENTCFDEGECTNWIGSCTFQGNCNLQEATGAVCRQDSGFCNPSSSKYMRTGPYSIIVKETNTYTVGAQFPVGWRPSNFAPTQATWSNNNGACDGALGYGLVQTVDKWCRVSPSQNSMTTSGGPITLTMSGQSSGPTEQLRLTLITKQTAPATTPTSLQIVDSNGQAINVPGTTWTNSGGRYYYNYNTTCNTGNGAPCSSQIAVSGLPAGDYYAFCSINSLADHKCTGNPNCTYEGLGGTVNCSTQQSCSTGNPDDNATISVTCNSVCTPACQQDNGCGVPCGGEDMGTPPTPIPLASQNITVNTNQAQHYATLSWQAGTYTGTPPTPPTTRYDLVIARQDGAVTNSATAGQAFNQCESTCDDFASTCNTTFNGSPIRCVKHNSIINLSHSYLPQLSIGNKIRVAVRAVNQSCSSFGNTAWGGFSNPVDYTLVQNVAGNFYADPGLTAAGSPVCLGAPTATSVPVGSTMQATPPNSSAMPATSVSGTNYTYLSVPYSPASWVEPKADLQLTIDNSGNPPESQIVCTCPDGCRYLDVINSPHTGVNFFLTTVDLSTESWWQTVNGLLYAARDTILSVIPDDCKADGTGTCVPYLITQDRTISDEASLLLSAGIPLSGTGDVAGTDKTVWLTERTPQARGSEATAHTQLERENFAYFQSKYDYENLTTLPTFSGTAVGLPTVNTVYKYSGNLQVRPGASPWRINAGETLIIFVEGTITFQGEDPASSAALFQVEEGGFLAFISSDNIVFDANVGNTDPANLSPSVSGVFISDGSITIEATSDSSLADKHFVGAGTFVAWDEANSGAGMIFNRNYADSGLGALDNNLYPTETFLYRPDFAYYMPEEMRSTDLFWQEVN